MKETFETLHSIMAKVNAIEDGLQALRDQVDAPIKGPINDSIRGAQGLRDLLWKVDKALEYQAETSKDAAKLLKELDEI